MSTFGENHILIDLYNALDDDPCNIHVHERLLETWIGLQDSEMALGIATALIQLDSQNEVAKRYLRSRHTRAAAQGMAQGMARPQDNSKLQSFAATYPSRLSDEDWAKVEKKLEEGYRKLQLDSSVVLHELQVASGGSEEQLEMLENLNHIVEGRISTVIPIVAPLSAREVARNVKAAPQDARDILTQDFELVVEWNRSQNPAPDNDEIRKRLIRRRTLMEAALPTSMTATLLAAFATIERDLLQKTYVNSGTMLMDQPLSTIPKDQFFVTEDNYAWDIEELAQAIESAGGVMRNPLSRHLFSISDIHAILAHPKGSRLKPLQEAQHRMRKGFRPTTINNIKILGQAMLQDQSNDARPSRNGMDEFLAYAATLPAAERQAINTFKIPANDRHTGQAFDYTIAESINDGKSNTSCFHKVGDFLSQAASYLERQ